MNTINRDTSSRARQPAKRGKPKHNRGALERILDMPFDIQFEIFGTLTPMDLLSVGRSSRDLHDFMKGPGSKCVWAQSRANHFPEMPECPEGMSEPAYAELFFGQGCLGCGKKNMASSQIYHIWEARTRLCSRCIRNTWINTESKEYRRGLPMSIRSILPSCNLMDPSGAPYVGECYVPRSMYQTLSEQYKSLKSPAQQDEWVEAIQQERLAIKEQFDDVQDFYVEYQEMLMEEEEEAENQAILERKAQVLELIKSLGWGEDLEKMTVDFFEMERDISLLCESPLKDHDLEMLKPRINTIMRARREARLLAERQYVAQRAQILLACYKDALKDYPSSAPRTHICDISAIPRIQAILLDSSTSQSPDDVRRRFFLTADTLRDTVVEAHNLLKSKLLSLVSAALPDKTFDPETVLNLATTVFRTVLPINMARYLFSNTMGVINWPVAYTPVIPGRVHSANDPTMIAATVFGAVPWNYHNVVCFDREAHDHLCRILRLCGFNPDITTGRQMREVNAVLECLSCRPHFVGRCLMPWKLAVSHAMRMHAQSNVEFILIDDAALAQEVRQWYQEMSEMSEARKARSSGDSGNAMQT
ncbi:hypothetical protein CVT24_004386 [Panaeolus cyanescens]|uniref:F-box domain-containing protein n=1 Tax=Panaeolus cyanescens TaxID=181874 RepID=A0A409VA02_9AGAR|nr:hypothetical protein CVT24_004386 [Panaeolus cyanescens]